MIQGLNKLKETKGIISEPETAKLNFKKLDHVN
jgi:hypothetical protein